MCCAISSSSRLSVGRCSLGRLTPKAAVRCLTHLDALRDKFRGLIQRDEIRIKPQQTAVLFEVCCSLLFALIFKEIELQVLQ